MRGVVLENVPGQFVITVDVDAAGVIEAAPAHERPGLGRKIDRTPTLKKKRLNWLPRLARDGYLQSAQSTTRRLGAHGTWRTPGLFGRGTRLGLFTAMAKKGPERTMGG